MPTLTIGDKTVTVGDDFLKLPPDQQNATVEEIAKSIGATAKTPPASGTSDLLQFPRGIVKGLAGFASAGAKGEELEEKQRAMAFGQPEQEMPATPSGEELTKLAVGGSPPTSGTGKLLESAGEFVGSPQSYIGPGGVVRKVIGAAAGGLGSEGLGELFSGTSLETPARIGGAVVAGGATSGTEAAVRKAITPETNVSADLSRALERDQMTPGDLAAKLARVRQVRPNATIADVGGENVRGLVERIAQTPGVGRTVVAPTLTARQTSQMGRLADDLSTLTGGRQSAVQATQETMAARAHAATPLYQQTYQDGDHAIWGPELERLSSAPSVQSAMRGAVRIWRDNAIADGYGAMNPGAVVDRGGQLSFLSGKVPVFPNLQFWDYTKRLLDDQVNAAVRAGQNQKARSLTMLTQQLRQSLDAAVPSYRAAREAWGGPTQYMSAIEEGRNILSTKIGAEELHSQLAGMTEAQREGYRIGAVSAIRGKMGNDPAKLADLTKYLRSPETRAKIAALMPTPEAAEAFENALDFEVQLSTLTGQALRGSQTARRLAERADAESIVGDLVMGAFAHGPTLGLLHRILLTVPGRVRDTLRSRSDALLADLLVNSAAAGKVPKALEYKPPVSAGGAVLPSALAGTSIAVGSESP